VTVAIHGEVDLSTADGLRGAASRAISSGASTLVLDLSDVTFMDSHGLKALLDAHATVRDAGATLVLERPQSAVRRLLDIMSLDGVFEVR
jgi:anti-sigma B factor antagonist